MGTNEKYDAVKGAGKGGKALVTAVVPIVVGAVAAAISDPNVVHDLKHAWPAIPAAVVVALANWFANWVKNR